MKKEKQKLLLSILGNGKYRVDSRLGIVQSFRKADNVWKGIIGNRIPAGYLQNTLFLKRGSGLKVVCYVHIIVWMSVHGEYEEGMVINHKDLDKQNNCIDNLECISVRDNVVHANNNVNFSKSVRSELNGQIRYEEICAIKTLLVEHPNWSKSRIARELSLNRVPVTRVINKIKKGEMLKYEVPGPYTSHNAKKRLGLI